MPEPTKAKTRKRAADGSTLEYEYWRGTWTDADGKRHSTNLGNVEVVNLNDARRRLVEAIKQSKAPAAESVTVADWTRQHIDNMNADPATISQYECARRQAIEKWGEHKRIRSVTTADVEELGRHIRDNPVREGKKKVSDYTVRNRLVSLGAMFARATVLPSKDRPYLRSNPFDDADIPNPKGGSESAYISIEQTKALLDACPDANIRALVALMRLMGMRLEEALSVEVEHINWTKQAIAVETRDERRGKGDSTKQAWRLVPMSPAANHLVLARFSELEPGARLLIDATPLTKGAQMKPSIYVRRLLTRAGILNVNKPNHDLRKSCADDWAMLHGCELSAKWCGHSVDVAIKHYRKKGDDALALVTGLGDPRATLTTAYKNLDAALNMR
jgi:integrase